MAGLSNSVKDDTVIRMSKLSIGIVGLPNVGKSTLFNVLTKQKVNAANYPFATIDPNVGVVAVPDERVDKLAEMSKSKQTIPAVVEFYDIAGLVRGAHKGEGLGNQFLTHIKGTNAIVHVVRCFGGSDVVHVEGAPDPLRDIDTIESELILKDLEIVERALERVAGKARTGDKEAKEELANLEKVKSALEAEKLLTDMPFARDMGLLMAKPQLFLLNGDESDITPALKQKMIDIGCQSLVVNLGKENAVPALIGKAYEILNLMSFLTTGEKETRAWTAPQGAKAPQCAGVIHSDFEKNFIRAEVVNWRDLLDCGSWVKARERGKIRVEGKEYVMLDGDVVYFRVGV